MLIKLGIDLQSEMVLWNQCREVSVYDLPFTLGAIDLVQKVVEYLKKPFLIYRYLIRKSTFEIKLIAFSWFFFRKLGAFVENSHSASGAKF